MPTRLSVDDLFVAAPDLLNPEQMARPEPLREQLIRRRVAAASAELMARNDPAWETAQPGRRLEMLNEIRKEFDLPVLQDVPGPQTASEYMDQDVEATTPVPFVSSIAGAHDLWRVYRASQRQKTGEATIEDQEILADFYERSVRSLRGRTVGAKALNIALGSIPFALELGITGGVSLPFKLLTRGGLQAAEIGATRAAAAGVGKAATTTLLKAGLADLGGMAARIGAGTAARTPFFMHRTVEYALQRRIPGYVLMPGDESAIDYFENSPITEPWLTSIVKAQGETWVAIGTEMAGPMLGRTGRLLGELPYIRVPFERIAGLRAELAAAITRRTGVSLADASRRLGVLEFHSLAEEVGEEYLEAILRGALTLDDEMHLPSLHDVQAMVLGFGGLRIGGAIGAEAAARTVLRPSREQMEKMANLLAVYNPALADELGAIQEPSRRDMPELASRADRSLFSQYLRQAIQKRNAEIDAGRVPEVEEPEITAEAGKAEAPPAPVEPVAPVAPVAEAEVQRAEQERETEAVHGGVREPEVAPPHEGEVPVPERGERVPGRRPGEGAAAEELAPARVPWGAAVAQLPPIESIALVGPAVATEIERAHEQLDAAIARERDAESAEQLRLQALNREGQRVEQTPEVQAAIKEATKGIIGKGAKQRRQNAAIVALGKLQKADETYQKAEHAYGVAARATAEAHTKTAAAQRGVVELERGIQEQKVGNYQAQLRPYPWWAIEHLISRLPEADPRREPANQVLGEKLGEQQERMAAAEKEPGVPPGRLPPAKPAAREAKPKPLPEWIQRAKARAAERAGTETYRLELQEGWATFREAKQRGEGLGLLKRFVSEVAEFAEDPVFTVTEDGRLRWSDGGQFTFQPAALGIRMPENVTPGQTIRVDVAAIKSLKKADLEEKGLAVVPVPAPAAAAGAPGFPARRAAAAAPTAVAAELPSGPTGGGYVRDLNPLGAREGAFRRTLKDKRKAISAQTEAFLRARRDGEKSAETDSIYQIVEELYRRLNLGPPGVGGRRMRVRLGFYEIKPESVTLKKATYAGVAFHELGHHIHKILFPRAVRPSGMPYKAGITAYDIPNRYRREMIQLGKDLYGETRPVSGYASEGFAQFVYYLFTNPVHARLKAPTAYAELVTLMVTEYPDLWRVILNGRVRLTNVRDFSAVNPIRQYIAYDEPRALSPRDAYDILRTTLFDRTQRAVTFKKDLKLKVAANEDPHIGALRHGGHRMGDTDRMIYYGTWNPADPGAGTTGPGLRDALLPVATELELWQEYHVARRILEKRAQGYDVLPPDPTLPEQALTNPAVQHFVDECDRRKPHFKSASEALRAFNDWLLNAYAVHYQLLRPELAKLIHEKNLEYITFRPVYELGFPSRFRARAHGLGGRAIRRFRPGEGERIRAPLQSYMNMLQALVAEARTNEVRRMFTRTWKTVDGAGRWLRKIDQPLRPVPINPEEVRRVLAAALGIAAAPTGELRLPSYLRDLTDEQLTGIAEALQALDDVRMAVFKRGRLRPEKMQLTTMEAGKPRYWEFKDAQLYDLLTGAHNLGQLRWYTWLGTIPGRILRAGATSLNVEFALANFVRDGIQSLVMTQAEKASLPAQVRARVEGLHAALKGGRLYDLYLASGAAMSGLFQEYRDPNGRIDIDRIFERKPLAGLLPAGSERGGWATAKSIAADILKLGPINRLNQAMELATRISEFELIRRGRTDPVALAEAGQAAPDVTLDFSRGGTLTKRLNQYIPFFNAAFLGTDKLGRFISQRPFRALTGISAFILLPTAVEIALIEAVGCPDDYFSKSRAMRDRYWYFATGRDDSGRSTYIKVPKPYALGLFGLLAERSYARSVGLDPATGKRIGDPRAFDGVAKALWDDLRPTVNLAGVMPLLEVLSGRRGYSFWFDREIVSAAEAELPIEEQGGARSSGLANFIARGLAAAGVPFAPAKIDYLIRGWTGGLGEQITRSLIDPMLGTVDPTLKRQQPLDFEDYLLVRRWVAGPTRSDHVAISQFYQDLQALEGRRAGWKRRQGDERQAYAERFQVQLLLYRTYERTARSIGNEFRYVRQIYRQPDLDPDDRNDRIDRAFERIIRQVRGALSARISLEESIEEREEKER